MSRIRRADAWTEDEFTRLASIVMDHVRNGFTQVSGINAAAKEMNRSVSACSFKWSTELRWMYDDEIRGLTRRKQAASVETRRKKRPDQREYTAKNVKYMGIAIDKTLHKRAKIHSIEADMTMIEIVNTALREYLEREKGVTE